MHCLKRRWPVVVVFKSDTLNTLVFGQALILFFHRDKHAVLKAEAKKFGRNTRGQYEGLTPPPPPPTKKNPSGVILIM